MVIKRKYQAFYILPEILNQYQVKCPLKIYQKNIKVIKIINKI